LCHARRIVSHPDPGARRAAASTKQPRRILRIGQVATYLALLQAEREDGPDRCNGLDPIDRLVKAFDDWVEFWARKDQEVIRT
jgi:hypothetical protein